MRYSRDLFQVCCKVWLGTQFYVGICNSAFAYMAHSGKAIVFLYKKLNCNTLCLVTLLELEIHCDNSTVKAEVDLNTTLSYMHITDQGFPATER